ncbi:hypothetical protein EHS25_007155 [Saitozyma podzolica]|uniref:Uncharacterized protein n=1 Tax=Saitozyma podzolica TaxID=1890683 RepID=A0A427XPB3_9TREE|nr:hypothetical protein EHS25_007155 [Saitozyma podzolica]
MSSRFVHSSKPKPHATSDSSRNELELNGASGSTQRSVKSQAASTSPPSWSSTSQSTGIHQSQPTALERQSSAALLPIYSQNDSQPRPHILPLHESAIPQAALFGAEPPSTGGCRVFILEQVNVRNEAALLDPGSLAAMWSSLEEQPDQTVPSQTKEDSVELSASIAAHLAAAWEAHNGHLARRSIDSHL